ncbi:MAG: PAS domain S-box protein [Alphaproteobacteria bacterium]|nr:PAS domain S-box protein [Alphaproteobacteria bacterium]
MDRPLDGGGIMTLRVDATENRRIQESLHALVDSMVDAVVTIDVRGTITMANPATARMFGYQAMELLGQNVSILMPNPDATEHGRNLGDYLRTGKAKVIGIGRSVVARRKDGSTFPVHLSVNEMHVHGARGFVGVMHDLTDLRRAEERLRAAFEVIGSGLALYDRDDRLLIHNRRYAEDFPELLAMAPLEGRLRRDIVECVVRSHSSDGHGRRIEAAMQPRDFGERRISEPIKDGRVFAVIQHVTRSGDRLVVRSDITADRRAMEQLESSHRRLEAQAAELRFLAESYAEARDRAEAADLAKSEFLATMSHEIRTPLNGVIGLAQVLQATRLDEFQREQVAAIVDSGRLLLALINDILDLSKLDSGRVELESVRFSLADVANRVAGNLADIAAAKRLTLAVDVPGHLPDLIGDPTRIQQVLFNLVGNALKFTAKGEVAVKVKVAIENETSRRCGLRVVVSDSGIGIPIEAQGRLFRRFSQADSTTTRRYGGTGLGLAICRQLIETMGGHIGFDSEPGKGSTFWFTLSLPVAGPETSPALEAQRSGAAALRPLRVLVAEDNAINRKVITGLLSAHGHDLTLVENGAEALSAVQRSVFDLVLMDVHMPVMDGPSAVAEIRALGGGYRDLQIIALTADAMQGDRERFLSLGMNDYVSKPIELDQLLAAMARVTGSAMPVLANGTKPAASAPIVLDGEQAEAMSDLLTALNSATKESKPPLS